MLGSSRVNPMKLDRGVDQVLRNIENACELDALVAIGGDDTLSVAARLAEQHARVVGVPKTMDNDLSVTDYCIGFDSAVSVVTEALDRLHTTATSHHRVMVCEVMGRDTGWVAVMGGLAGGADMIIIPEFSVTRRRGGRASRGAPPGRERLQHHRRRRGRRDGRPADQKTRRKAHATHSGMCSCRGAVSARLSRASSKNAPATRRAQQCSDTCSVAVRRPRMTASGQRVSAPRRMTSSSRDSSARCRWSPTARSTSRSIADVVAEQRRVPRELYELAQVFY